MSFSFNRSIPIPPSKCFTVFNFDHGSYCHLRNRATVYGMTLISARDYKTFIMLSSAEHEISNAHQYKTMKKFSFSSGSDGHRMLFFLPINVKMPTTVGILIIMNRKKFHA